MGVIKKFLCISLGIILFVLYYLNHQVISVKNHDWFELHKTDIHKLSNIMCIELSLISICMLMPCGSWDNLIVSSSWSLHADSSCDSNVFRKVGGRHGMVFGYVSPKAIHLAPLVPGTVSRLWSVCLLDVDEEWIERRCWVVCRPVISLCCCMLPVVSMSSGLFRWCCSWVYHVHIFCLFLVRFGK